jgi:hypothetical protein
MRRKSARREQPKSPDTPSWKPVTLSPFGLCEDDSKAVFSVIPGLGLKASVKAAGSLVIIARHLAQMAADEACVPDEYRFYAAHASAFYVDLLAAMLETAKNAIDSGERA